MTRGLIISLALATLYHLRDLSAEGDAPPAPSGVRISLVDAPSADATVEMAHRAVSLATRYCTS